MDTMLPYEHLIKIVVIGDSAVGKSSLLSKYVDNSVTEAYSSTIGVDFKIKNVNIDGSIVKLQIWDTAGQDRFKVITHSYYRGADVVLVVFSLNDRESYNTIYTWYAEAKQLTLDGTKIVLVGCKSDLNWEVGKGEVRAIAEDLHIPWIICSAYKGIGINDVFDMAIKQVLDSRCATHYDERKGHILLSNTDPRRTGCGCNIL